jgi:chaperonin GroES
MKLKPLADRVVVKPADDKEQRRGGIIIPDTAREKPLEGKVIAVGSGRLTNAGTRIRLDVKKGDSVLYGEYSGTEVSLNRAEWLIMRESDILAVITTTQRESARNRGV